MKIKLETIENNAVNNKKTVKLKKYDYTVAIAVNPNVGKSTIFNSLTGMHQHTQGANYISKWLSDLFVL